MHAENERTTALLIGLLRSSHSRHSELLAIMKNVSPEVYRFWRWHPLRCQKIVRGGCDTCYIPDILYHMYQAYTTGTHYPLDPTWYMHVHYVPGIWLAPIHIIERNLAVLGLVDTAAGRFVAYTFCGTLCHEKGGHNNVPQPISKIWLRAISLHRHETRPAWSSISGHMHIPVHQEPVYIYIYTVWPLRSGH